MTHAEHVRDEYWDGGPALHIYVVEDYNDSIDVEPETVNPGARLQAITLATGTLVGE